MLSLSVCVACPRPTMAAGASGVAITWSFGLPDDMVRDPGKRVGAERRATDVVECTARTVGRANLTKLRDANMQWYQGWQVQARRRRFQAPTVSSRPPVPPMQRPGLPAIPALQQVHDSWSRCYLTVGPVLLAPSAVSSEVELLMRSLLCLPHKG